MQTRVPWLIAIVLTAPAVRAAEESPTAASVGQLAPPFTLPDLEGHQRSLGDYKDQIVVLEWLSADCPASLFARPTVNELYAKYKDKGVIWLGIDSTHYQTVETLKKYKQKRQVKYDILVDHDGRVGRMYGAKTTPHVFIIHKGELVYAGALDNGGFRRKGDRNYVAEALDAILADKPVAMSTTVPYGCSIKYAPRKRPQEGVPRAPSP